MKIVSPVTGRNTAVHVETLQTDRIIAQYREELGIDVSRYFQNLSEIHIYECEESKYRFFHPPGILGDSAFYEALQNVQKGDYYPREKWEYQQALQVINPGDAVLEIGSGAGHFLRKALQKKAVVTGLELNESAAEACRQSGLDVRTELLHEHIKTAGRKYDVVCAFQVLEHISDVRSFINDCLSALKKDGYLIFAVPNSDPYLFGHDLYHTLNLPPHHAGLWKGETMKKLEMFFNIKLARVDYEPLKEYKKWYQVQLAKYKETKPLFAALLAAVPRQVYKPLIKLFKSRIQGIYLIAVFKKINL